MIQGRLSTFGSLFSELMFRAALGAFFFVALTGLSFPTKLTLPASAPAVSYVFQDDRDPKLFRSASESLMITNCAYGAVRVGERDIDPDLAVLLNAMLGNRFGERLAGKRVSLRTFAVHLNNAAALRAMNARMYTGLIPSMMNKESTVGCASEDTRGGYALGEVPSGAVPLIVVIDLRIDDQTFRSRSIAPFRPLDSPAKKSDPAFQANWNMQVDAGVQVALSRLGDQIEEQLSIGNDDRPSDEVRSVEDNAFKGKAVENVAAPATPR